MTRLWIACSAAIALTASAAPATAQSPAPSPAPAPGDAPLAAFLENRVPEELAAEGMVLSRRNLGLQLEQVASKWLVSLVDLTTGRVAASTRVDSLPADREAAVAAMTHVVSDLAAQVVGRAEPQATPPPAPAAPGDERRERDERERAELTYQRQSLRFSKVLVGGTEVNAGDRRNWTAYQGELDKALEPEEFYRLVDRPDLTSSFQTRRTIKYVSYGAALAGYAAAIYLTATAGGDEDCSRFLSGPGSSFEDYDRCIERNEGNYIAPLVVLGVGSVALYTGIWFSINAHPISANDAKALADKYNQGLRGRLGLPVVARRPLVRELKLVPYVASRDAGLVLTARF